ncbi:lipopolysaccharide biosynthesis protein [Vagococcus carniphilus]|uniref:lipopolysaccharide biosynthesis protein n=1 Tax=Vagococcus carniphilus TaxID=218144 RepID=UPI003B5C2E17
MNIYKKLFSNSLIFAIGNLGSKLIVILLVPLYTYTLSTTEYGVTDIITTTSNLVLPLITLSIYEAVLRFTMDKDYDKEKVLTSGFFITLVGNLFLLLMIPIIKNLTNNDYLVYFYLLLMIQTFQSLLSQYVRAVGKVKEFAINGILNAFLVGSFNVLFLVKLKYGISGYLLSIIIAGFISVVYLSVVSEVIKIVKIRKFDLILSKTLIKYSIPLIPNSFMWWVINTSNRYFIVYFIGMSENGLFSVANKIPSILSIFQSIFFQAWQLSAIDEYDSENKDKFYSNVFNFFSAFMIIVTSGILLFLRIIIRYILSPEYYLSWKYVPFLLIGILFSSFSSFYGTNYIAAKKTSGVLTSSLLGAAINVFLCYILIPGFGVNGASFATMISFLFMWGYRVFDTRKMISIDVKWKKLFANLLTLFLQIFYLYYGKYTFLNSIFLFMILLINLKELKVIYNLIKVKVLARH